jgi:predicted Zn-dependent protease
MVSRTHQPDVSRPIRRQRRGHGRCRGIRLAVLVLATLYGTACGDPTAAVPDFAYDPTTLTGGVLYRWSTGTRVRVFVEPAPSTGVSLATATQRAAQQWNAAPARGEVALDIVTDRNVADVIVYDRGTPQPVVAGLCPFEPSGAAGYTYFCNVNGRAEKLRPVTSTVKTASVVIRVDMTTTATQSQLDALVSHEMGHAVGIGGHSPDAADLMYTRPTVTAPTARDRQTLRHVLGRPADLTL